MQITIYRHLFPSGKSYIGITSVTPYHRRWRGGSGYCNQPKMYNAILKYGWDNITHEIIAQVDSLDHANILEQEFIQIYDSVNNGYNVSLGGGGTYGIPCSDETKRKIALANSGKPTVHGNKFLLKYQKENGSWNKGKKLSKAHHQKIAQERQKRCNKQIVAIDPNTGLTIHEFDSCTIASQTMGVSKNCISRCAKGGRPTCAGYKWRYAE